MAKEKSVLQLKIDGKDYFPETFELSWHRSIDKYDKPVGSMEPSPVGFTFKAGGNVEIFKRMQSKKMGKLEMEVFDLADNNKKISYLKMENAWVSVYEEYGSSGANEGIKVKVIFQAEKYDLGGILVNDFEWEQNTRI